MFFECILIYGTNHPQLRQHTRVAVHVTSMGISAVAIHACTRTTVFTLTRVFLYVQSQLYIRS